MDIFKLFRRQKVVDTKTCSQQVDDYTYDMLSDTQYFEPEPEPENEETSFLVEKIIKNIKNNTQTDRIVFSPNEKDGKFFVDGVALKTSSKNIDRIKDALNKSYNENASQAVKDLAQRYGFVKNKQEVGEV